MDHEYFNWPGENQDLIMVSDHKGSCPVPNHRHDFVEIVFITKGSCTHSYLGSKVGLIPGDAFIVVPHEDHSYEIDSETAICNLIFYPGVLGEDWAELKEMSGLYNFIVVEPFFRFETNENQILHFQPDELAYVESLLSAMRSEQHTRQKGFRLAQKANLTALLIFIGRIWEKSFPEQAEIFKKKRSLISDAIVYIEDNIEEGLNVREIASKVFLSPDYFRKVFREVTGMSPVEYINRLRMSKAEALLKESGRTVGEIAEIVGIGDVNYFSKLFRSSIGCTPTEYRKRNVFY